MTSAENFSLATFNSFKDIKQRIEKENVTLLSRSPFTDIAFFELLEDSGSVGKENGWDAQHIGVCKEQELMAILPCYLKTHSYGEYVFDQAWANAYYQHGLDYYPKLLCAIPFTPVTQNKLLISEKHASLENEVLAYIASQWPAVHEGVSSIHCLFLLKQQVEIFKKYHFHQRLSVQFIFYNHDFRNFEDFLASLKSRKRKMIKKERMEVHRLPLKISRYTQDEITPEIMHSFYLCYQQTYLKRSGHKGYLTQAFFQGLLKRFKNNVMLCMAEEKDNFVAGALFFYDEHNLYGRYWGALQEFSYLHFECCYYQGIEFAIEREIKSFNPGTQGEHKILRGFTPTYCYSMHKMRHPSFDNAVKDFTEREAPHIKQYFNETSALLPFKT